MLLLHQENGSFQQLASVDYMQMALCDVKQVL